jgi:hypothetical protein
MTTKTGRRSTNDPPTLLGSDFLWRLWTPRRRFPGSDEKPWPEITDDDGVTIVVAGGPPPRLTLGLADGSPVEVWAHGLSRVDDHYTFTNVVTLEGADAMPQDGLVIGEPAGTPRRYNIAVAQFHKNQVHLIQGEDKAAALTEWP